MDIFLATALAIASMTREIDARNLRSCWLPSMASEIQNVSESLIRVLEGECMRTQLVWDHVAMAAQQTPLDPCSSHEPNVRF
jgi:hypothetical protein